VELFLLTLWGSSAAAFDDLLQKRPTLVAIGQWEDSLLPLDVLLTSLAVFGNPSAPGPDFIVATRNSLTASGLCSAALLHGRLDPVPESAVAGLMRVAPRAWADGPGAVQVWNFPLFPAAARPFAIPDRLGSV
jgi:hypothetical protein